MEINAIDEMMPDILKMYDILKEIIFRELEKKEVPSKELLDTIQLAYVIAKSFDLTFNDFND